MAKKNNNSDGTHLAKVLWYYNLIPNINHYKHKIMCPFHGDVNPSLLVNLKEGRWFCFGCNESGDAITFVKLMEKKYHKLNDLQAYRQYCEILKSKKCSDIEIDQARIAKETKPQKQMYDEAYDYYHGLRTVNWLDDEEPEVLSAKEYMSKRGFSSETLNKCKAKVTYNYSYGLIFPMLDNGKFRGWVCRTMRKEIEERRKYLYNEGFSRATTVVGNYGKTDYVIVVEGYMDRLKFVQNGIEDNVIAILGWKMSQQQEEKLRAAGITKVISALDNDECGKKGTKYLEKIFGASNVTRFCYLKGIKDPGEMEPKPFRRMYEKTMAVFSQKYKSQKGEVKNGRISK